MKNYTAAATLVFFLFIALSGCQPERPPVFKEALTFYVSFDDGVNADFALGDKSIYTALSRIDVFQAEAGMNNADHEIVSGKGKWGDAFRFGRKSDTIIFYKSKDNIIYSSQSWSGTISFWLSLDPETDLEPGYTDPIQITDVRYDDASIWVDFTNENPRDFRLGVFGDKDIWSQDTLNSSRDAEFERRTVRVKSPPFSGENWTHVAITYKDLGTAQSAATLYLNGEKIGSIEGIDDPFTWNLEDSNIYIGLNFTGLMDELSIFNTPLTEGQIQELYNMEGGLKPILN